MDENVQIFGEENPFYSGKIIPEMKVLIINSTLDRSGLTNAIYNIARDARKHGVEMHIITLSPEPITSRQADFEAAGVTVHALSLGRAEAFFLLKSKLKQKVKEISPDIIHTHSYRGSYYAMKYLSNYKRMVTLHAVLQDNYVTVYGSFIGNRIARLELEAYKQAGYRTVVSRFLQDHYAAFGNSRVICNGADAAIFHPVARVDKQRLRTELGLPQDKVIYVFAADLIQRKDPLTLIQAFKQAGTENSLLLILGDGPMKKACLELSGPNVILAGKVSNVSDYFKAADVFISTSLSEGQGLSALEAAMCGLPCLLTDLPVHKEYFENDLQQAYFFEKGNVSQLSDLIGKYPYQACNPVVYDMKDTALMYYKAYQEFLESN